jgi:hypothetical protein
MGDFNAHKWFKKQYLEEGHTEDKMERDMEARKRSKLSPDELKKVDALRAFYRGETEDLKENMSPAEAVVELNYYMNDLQDISAAVSRIMQQTFPGEYRRGEAYGAFDFGSSRNQFDITFESILDNLASVGDEDEIE